MFTKNIKRNNFNECFGQLKKNTCLFIVKLLLPLANEAENLSIQVNSFNTLQRYTLSDPQKKQVEEIIL